MFKSNRFFRFVSKRFTKSKRERRDNADSVMSPQKDSDIECIIMHLDNTDFKFYIDKKALGKTLEEYVFQQIEIFDDKNYFGLMYTDKKGAKHWLDISKQIRKQCEIGPPYTLQFRVKFFSSDPSAQLRDEHTRYLFVLQLKQLIRDGVLRCESLDQAADLAALSLQGELGDHDELVHDAAFISQFQFLPKEEQIEEFEIMVLEKFRALKDRNLLPSITDRQYLEICRYLPDYGVDKHYVKDINNKDYTLGLTPSGILIYEDDVKIGLFPWNKVTKLKFSKNRFKIVVLDTKEDDEGELEHTFEFFSVQTEVCKHLWKSCVEHHSFFRLEGAHKPPTRVQKFFRLKSRFYASFHTEYEMAVRSQFGSSMRRSSTFQRTPSVRTAPRESFLRNEAERRRLQQKYREQMRKENKEALIERMDMSRHNENKNNNNVVKPSRPPAPPTATKMNLMTNMKQQNTPRSMQPIRSESDDSSDCDNKPEIQLPSKMVRQKQQPQAYPRSSNSSTDVSDSDTYILTKSKPQPKQRSNYVPTPTARNISSSGMKNTKINKQENIILV